MLVEFTVPGQPVAKGRPRFARRGANVVAYTPAKTVSYERLVALAAKVAMAGRGPSEQPLHLAATISLQVPESWSNRRREAALSGAIRATKRPDLDNYVKGIFDGCNGILWQDDAQIVEITLRKDYARTPGATVAVRELQGEAA
jgi:Holliday junction resolvase RusA-like endonuclease